MKKIIFSLVAIALFSIGSMNAQQTNEGEMHVDVYIGGPNLLKSTLKTTYANSSASEKVTFGGVPNIGLRFGYLVSDKASVGVDINYSNTIITYLDEGIDPETNLSKDYETTLSVPRLKAMVRFELHFGNSDNFDLYWPIAAGLNKTSYKFTSTDPNFKDDTDISLSIPVAFRTGIGGRYFFTDNIGANVEIGIGGGALLEFGLAMKF